MYANDKPAGMGRKPSVCSYSPCCGALPGIGRWMQSCDGVNSTSPLQGRRRCVLSAGSVETSNPRSPRLAQHRPGRSRLFAVRRFDGDCHLIPAGGSAPPEAPATDGAESGTGSPAVSFTPSRMRSRTTPLLQYRSPLEKRAKPLLAPASARYARPRQPGRSGRHHPRACTRPARRHRL